MGTGFILRRKWAGWTLLPKYHQFVCVFSFLYISASLMGWVNMLFWTESFCQQTESHGTLMSTEKMSVVPRSLFYQPVKYTNCYNDQVQISEAWHNFKSPDPSFPSSNTGIWALPILRCCHLPANWMGGKEKAHRRSLSKFMASLKVACVISLTRTQLHGSSRSKKAQKCSFAFYSGRRRELNTGEFSHFHTFTQKIPFNLLCMSDILSRLG